MAIEMFDRWKCYRHAYFHDVYFMVVGITGSVTFPDLDVIWITNQGTAMVRDRIQINDSDLSLWFEVENNVRE